MLGSRTSLPGLLAVLGALLVAAWFPGAASAATQVRYAAPDGSGSYCTSASPCSITEAVNDANYGNEVIVRPGDYLLTDTLGVSFPVTIHGVAGYPRPRLLFSRAAQKGMRLDLGGALRYVEIDQAGSRGAVFADRGADVDQVIVRADGGLGEPAARIRDATIRNSIVVASGTNAVALLTESNFGPPITATYRNVTAVATGSGSVAIDAYGDVNGSVTANLLNVIADGGAAGLPIRAHTDSGPGAAATMTVTHSVYASSDVEGAAAKIVDGGGNRWEQPAFVNTAAGDYRQARGSYTINAGMNDPATGALDVDGDPRAIGTTDIGADEFLAAPAATTGAAGAVTEGSTALGGSVNPNGAPTSYRVEYGPTTAYGTTTAATSAGSGTGTRSAGVTLGGLRPATTYHYRLVATNAGGVRKGGDRTFTTLPAPATTPPARAFAGVELVSTRLTYARRSITVRLRCPRGTVGRCSGRAKLTARRRHVGTRRITPRPRRLLDRAGQPRQGQGARHARRPKAGAHHDATAGARHQRRPRRRRPIHDNRRGRDDPASPPLTEREDRPMARHNRAALDSVETRDTHGGPPGV
jgi:hypothetical protein